MTELYSNIVYFLLYAIASAGLYRLTPPRYKSAELLFVSILFYVLCAGWYVFFVLSAGLWSFFCARKMEENAIAKQNKKWLISGIVPLLLLLCVFKYWTPASSLLGRILSNPDITGLTKVILPLGMSYYILKSLSYIIDVYKKKINREKNIVNYLAYISFYGQIVSGPIQRYEQWYGEITRKKPIKKWQDGFYLILLGLFMKLVIANRLKEFIDATVLAPDAANGLQLWLCFFLYAIYIYCDFAGYSYIAIGVTHFHGIDCIDNFNRPYFSKDIREFWSRWHISLSSWLKDYLYIPLGGNRKGKIRRVLNVMITFVVCGIWHGSTLNFVVWGGFHGVANALTPKKKSYGRLQTIGNTILTFVIACTGWVFFSTPTLKASFDFFKGMFTRLSFSMTSIQEAVLPFTGNNLCLSFLITVLLFIIILAVKECNDIYGFFRKTEVRKFVWNVFLLTSIFLFGVFGASSFIYAGF